MLVDFGKYHHEFLEVFGDRGEGVFRVHMPRSCDGDEPSCICIALIILLHLIPFLPSCAVFSSAFDPQLETR